MNLTIRVGMSRRTSALTLIELLVVIAIIAILAILTASAYREVIARSQAVGCLQSLRNYNTGIQGFAADHNNLLPPDGNGSDNLAWYTAVAQWDASAFPVHKWQCPGNPNRADINKSQPTDPQKFTYAYNGAFSVTDFAGPTQQPRLIRFDKLSKIPIFMDATMTPLKISYYHILPHPTDTEYVKTRVGFWHNDKCHVLFLDGHTEAVPNTETGRNYLRYLLWDVTYLQYRNSR